MAAIKLEPEALKSINSEISSLDQSLLSSYFPELTSELEAVRSNVQNAEINQMLTTIGGQADSIKSALSTELPKLENFLNEQLNSYTTTEAEAEAAVNSVVAKMASVAGTAASVSMGSNGTVTGAQSSANGQGGTTSTQGTQENSYNRGDKYAETWGSWWNDVSDAYSDTHGVFSAIGNTAEVILDTGGALVETAGNAASDALGVTGDAVSWVMGNALSWIFS